jgi:hypothetical protein
MTDARFHIHNDRCEWHMAGSSGEVAYLTDGTFTEKVQHIINGLPGRTWHGYRGNMTIVQHGKGVQATDTRGIIMGRWQPQSSSTITIIASQPQPTADAEEQPGTDAEH